jgi:hypothetical protein
VNSTNGRSYISARCNKVDGATKYRFYRYNGKSLQLLAETTKNAVKINGTKSGKQYTLAVRAFVNGKWTTVTKSDLVSIKSK